jgi:hypothetical protein
MEAGLGISMASSENYRGFAPVATKYGILMELFSTEVSRV